MAGTLSDRACYDRRQRVCNLGYLREVYRRDDGTLGYRCAAEDAQAYADKGGDPANTHGRKCLCNSLLANAGMPQELEDGTQELCLVTLGDDYANATRFFSDTSTDYTAADVIRLLLS